MGSCVCLFTDVSVTLVVWFHLDLSLFTCMGVWETVFVGHPVLLAENERMLQRTIDFKIHSNPTGDIKAYMSFCWQWRWRWAARSWCQVMWWWCLQGDAQCHVMPFSSLALLLWMRACLQVETQSFFVFLHSTSVFGRKGCCIFLISSFKSFLFFSKMSAHIEMYRYMHES